MKHLYLLIFLIVFSIRSTFALTYTQWGDINQVTNTLVSLTLSTYYNDKEGALDIGFSFLSAQATTLSLKYAFNETELGRRPNGGEHSFPSGHTTAAFSGVYFLHKKYGPYFSIPALFLAMSVGHSRIEGNYHHLRDVIVGALISISYDYFYTEKKRWKIFVAPNEEGHVTFMASKSF